MMLAFASSELRNLVKTDRTHQTNNPKVKCIPIFEGMISAHVQVILVDVAITCSRWRDYLLWPKYCLLCSLRTCQVPTLIATLPTIVDARQHPRRTLGLG